MLLFTTTSIPLFFLLLLLASFLLPHYLKKKQMTTAIISGLPKESLNHGCTDLPIDPKFETTLPYDYKYIENTVYHLAEQDDSLGHSVKQALQVIEKSYKDFG